MKWRRGGEGAGEGCPVVYIGNLMICRRSRIWLLAVSVTHQSRDSDSDQIYVNMYRDIYIAPIGSAPSGQLFIEFG